MSRQDELEARLDAEVEKVAQDFGDLGEQQRWAMTCALIHRAVHYATAKPGVEFCSLATYLAEMIGHAHKLAHGDNPKAPTHTDRLH